MLPFLVISVNSTEGVFVKPDRLVALGDSLCFFKQQIVLSVDASPRPCLWICRITNPTNRTLSSSELGWNSCCPGKEQ